MNELVGTVQRNQVVDLLGEALAQGYLDLADFDRRMSFAAAARTQVELMNQVADLPPQFRWDPRKPPWSTKGKRSSTTATSITSLVLGVVSIPLVLCFGIGGLFGAAAVLLGIPGLRDVANRGKALTGFVLGCVSVAVSVGIILFVVV